MFVGQIPSLDERVSRSSVRHTLYLARRTETTRTVGGNHHTNRISRTVVQRSVLLPPIHRPDTLVIKRIVASKVIPLSEIESAEPYQRTMNFVRTCGSGGFLGYWGWYHNQELKHFFVYATNLNQLVLVRLRSGRKYVISCTDAPSMATEIARQLRN